MVSIEGILMSVTGREMPKGNESKATAAAGDWQLIAGRVDSSLSGMDKVEAILSNGNKDKGIDGFVGYYTKTLQPFPPQVSKYMRNISTACTQFAQELPQVRNALTIIAVNIWANIIMTLSYGWITGFAAELAEANIARLTGQAIGAFKWWATLLKTLLYYFYDAILYAGIQQGLQYGIMKGGESMLGVDNQTMTLLNGGKDQTSLATNWDQFKQGFVANVAYDATLDGAGKIPKVGKFFDRGNKAWTQPTHWYNGWGARGAGLAGRMLSSNAYTMANNGYAGNWGTPPTGAQEEGKLFMHVPRSWIYPYPRGKNAP